MSDVMTTKEVYVPSGDEQVDPVRCQQAMGDVLALLDPGDEVTVTFVPSRPSPYGDDDADCGWYRLVFSREQTFDEGDFGGAWELLWFPPAESAAEE